MSEFHVVVVKLGKIGKHPHADNLSITQIHDGYPCIFRTGQFQPGDLAVYCPIDSIVSLDRPQFSFFADDPNYKNKKEVRIKAKKIRNIFSMGLLIKADPSWEEGKNVQEELGIKKWDPEVALSTGGLCESNPGFFPIYYDMDSLRKHKNIIQEGEEVVITEKTHGCLTNNQHIRMADGSKKIISKIKVGDYVLGMKDGYPIPSKVLQCFNNGKSDCWLRIESERRAAGKGNSFARIKCTPEHNFYIMDKDKYIQAKDLKVGDIVGVIRSDFGLTPIQEQVLLGKILGDAHLSVAPSGNCAAVVFGHADKHLSYVNYTNTWLSGLSEIKDQAISGYGSTIIRSSTKFSKSILDKFSSFIKNGRKTVPSWVIEELTPISIAFWYMDDGSLGHHNDQEDRANFATCSFNEEECSLLILALKKFNIIATYNRDCESYSRIKLNADNAEKLFLLIAPYICKELQYKLPERYRGLEPFCPKDGLVYKKSIMPQKITKISDITKTTRSKRYDIKTETGNYFAPDVLVHNSNGRWLYRDGRLWVGSHKQVKAFDPNNAWWKIAQQYDLEEKLSTVKNIVIYGEVAGQVQDLKYGAKPGEIFLSCFDALDSKTNQYLDYLDFVKLTDKLSLPRVPVLYQGPWSENLWSLAEGKTTYPGADHVREGFVIRPVRERFFGQLERTIFKLVGEGYLLRKESK